MKNKRTFIYLFFFIFSLLIASCSAGSSNSQSVQQSSAPSTNVVQSADVKLTKDNAGNLLLPSEETTLLLYSGDAELSSDGGKSFQKTKSGAILLPGDEVRLSQNGFALVVFPKLGFLRLEGNAEYRFVEYSYDPTSGDLRVSSRLNEGAAIFEINPLPTEKSIFSLGLRTGLIQVHYDSKWQKDVKYADFIDPENSIITAAAVATSGEVITHFRGPVALYQLGTDGKEFYAYQPAAYKNLEQSITLEINKPDIEEEIMNFLPISDFLLDQYVYGMTPEYSGYVITGEKPLKDDSRVIYFNKEVGTISGLGEINKNSIVRKPNVDVSGGIIPILSDSSQLGCDVFSGSGCPLNESCNLSSGEGCQLITRCNPVTGKDCAPLPSGCLSYKDGKLMIPSVCLFMPITEFNLKPDCFFKAPNWVCDQTSCFVCVSPDPKMGTPPEGWQPCHPACCCEPGARSTKP